MSEVAAPIPADTDSPLRSVGFRWLMLFRICTLLSYQIAAVTVGHYGDVPTKRGR